MTVSPNASLLLSKLHLLPSFANKRFHYSTLTLLCFLLVIVTIPSGLNCHNRGLPQGRSSYPEKESRLLNRLFQHIVCTSLIAISFNITFRRLPLCFPQIPSVVPLFNIRHAGV
ncbi:hypothetical protein T459_23609 [Capsicum annuum]|uniref:Uncharacterized protein n=2 Tax=Capsicum annuum TaxID=4072 RepID=A0A075VWP4_CAPAN|nr:hypothetical protein [Capsicum annuum]AIG89817.1 hypothetical protein [Capsicum annuum]AIG90160.1 hypothetical protein [Capsicum annuum]PHT72824.1 hypothetical protein T459_23609 [Capsicum annuum]QFV19649.1 hypothetical protein [Capsicum annuum var. glabriusculum]